MMFCVRRIAVIQTTTAMPGPPRMGKEVIR